MKFHERGAQMKQCRKCGVEKVLDEFYRDKKSSDGKHSYCKECERARRRKYHYDNHEKSTAASQGWKARNKQHTLAKTQEWRAKNIDHIREQQKEYRANNREKVNETYRNWYRRNPKKKAARDKRRYFALSRATPDWVSDSDLAPFYLEAAMMTEKTGIPHEVDHIIPLQNPAVCGLNVPWNLQVLTRSENARKSNSFNCDDIVRSSGETRRAVG